MPHISATMEPTRTLSVSPHVPDPDWVAVAGSPPVSEIHDLGIDSDSTGLAYSFAVVDVAGDALPAQGTVDVSLVEVFDDGSECAQGVVLTLNVGEVRFEPGVGPMRFAFRLSAVSGLHGSADSLVVWTRGSA